MSSNARPLVLITGLTGYIALHIAHGLLNAGYRVRGTVRSASKAQHALSLPALRPFAHSGQLESTIVPDVQTGPYDAALQGVEVVVHAASPVSTHADMPWAEHKRPAVEGALAVHRAALAVGVKHIVHLSSFAAMCDFVTPLAQQDGRVHDEASWNPITDDVAERLEEILPADKQRAIGGIRYGASKMFSERAVWDLHDASASGRDDVQQREARCKLTVLCPPTVLGPPLDTLTPASQQGFSVSRFATLLSGSDTPVPNNVVLLYVDVRDVADAVLCAIEHGTEGRFGICAGVYDHQYLADRMRVLFPSLEVESRIARGQEGMWQSRTGPKNAMDVSRAARDLHMTYRPMDDTIRDTVEVVLQMERDLGQL